MFLSYVIFFSYHLCSHYLGYLFPAIWRTGAERRVKMVGSGVYVRDTRFSGCEFLLTFASVTSLIIADHTVFLLSRPL